MNVVFISPHFPPNYYLFCLSLRDAGANVLALGDAPYHELCHDLQQALTEYYYVQNMTDLNAMRAACGHFVEKFGSIDRLDSNAEFWLEIEAILREEFGIPGQTRIDTQKNRTKQGMKDVFIENAIPCATGEQVKDADQVRAFVKRYGLPVIMKPDVGVGAADTFKIETEKELDSFLQNIPQDYIIEEVLTGDLISFDGIADQNSDLVFFTSHEFSAGVMEIVHQQLQMHYFNVPEPHPALVELGKKTVKAFGIKERFFHIEYFRTSPTDYKALEVNVRPPGGFTTDMMNYSCDINVYSIWANMIVNGMNDVKWERKYCVAHSSRRHIYNYRFGHEELISQLGPIVAAHMPVPDAFSGAMGNYVYMLRHPDLDTLKAAIAKVEELV